MRPDEDPGRSRFKELLSSALDFARDHVLLSVGIFLTSSWFAIAFVVYEFEAQAKDRNILSIGDAIWWGIVTMLTVGYGDRYPITTGGRVAACLLMAAGVLAVGIFTAKVSSIFLERALREARGVMDVKSLQGHIIVCGWKRDLHRLLVHILDFNPGLGSDHLILIAHVKTEEMDFLKGHPRLKEIKIILGDFYAEETLRRAAPQRAHKILLLADQTPNATGQMPTTAESDARTVMTAMTLSSIARGVSVAAEILDPKMDQYLRLAHVNEIIYSREYSRFLLGNASSGTGVMNVIHDLLDPATNALLTTVSLDEASYNQPYSKLRERFQADLGGTRASRRLLIGVVENSGNSHQVKEAALRRAQQTADVAKMVENLQTVKHLKFNHPIFNPSDDYVVPAGSMAIVIENRAAVEGVHA